MAGYEDLDIIIGEMKRAAIDAFMADFGYSPQWGHPEIYAKWHFADPRYWRPAEDGHGGGDPLPPSLPDPMIPAAERVAGRDGPASLAPQFDDIRFMIDQLVGMWRGLPDGSASADLENRVMRVSAQLGVAGSSASVANNGELDTANGTVGDVVRDRLDGSFRSPFLDKYYTQFSKIKGGLGQVARILEANYAAESAMWPSVRDDVASICEAAQSTWAAYAKAVGDASTATALSVIEAVATAVSAVVTAGGSAGMSVAVLALSTVSGGARVALTTTDASRDGLVAGKNFDTILKSFHDELTRLQDAISEQEQIVNKMLLDATQVIRDSPSTFDLDAYSLTDSSASNGWMRMSRSDADIVSSNMTRIEDALADVTSHLGNAPDSAPAPRGAGIGISPTGTHEAASELYDLTARCLRRTGAEYGRGHALFDATAEDYFSADADAHRMVKALAAEEALINPTEV